jgi:hypothetical protein
MLHYITCSPATLRFAWEIAVQLNNAREKGISHQFRVLLFYYKNSQPHPNMLIVEKMFPEAKFFYYEDLHDIKLDVDYFQYESLIRPYMLRRHFKDHPELEKDIIFYLDSDVLFLYTDFIPELCEDNVNYLSDTYSYLGIDYFYSKYETENEEPKFVRPEVFAEFKRIDVLDELAQRCYISKDVIIENKYRVGGAQYILKNVHYSFWSKVYQDACSIRIYLLRLNQRYMKGATAQERENNGYQSWCADMWSLLWNLYKLEVPVTTPYQMDFVWATDPIEKEGYILHNAGITSDSVIRSNEKDENKNAIIVDAPAFFKGKYSGCTTPFEDVEYLNSIISHPVSQKYYTARYTEEILKTKQNLNL